MLSFLWKRFIYTEMAKFGIPPPKFPISKGCFQTKCTTTEVWLALASDGRLSSAPETPVFRAFLPMEKNRPSPPGVRVWNWYSASKIPYIQGSLPDKICQYHLIWLALASGDCPSSAPEALGLGGFLPVETMGTR